VWKGTQKQSEHALLDTPVAITSFISESTGNRQPNLAVAAGSHIYIYRNLRPYYKFVLPPEVVNDEEQECW
jgi:Bardet-Biedl syndrome 1 protein